MSVDIGHLGGTATCGLLGVDRFECTAPYWSLMDALRRCTGSGWPPGLAVVSTSEPMIAGYWPEYCDCYPSGLGLTHDPDHDELSACDGPACCPEHWIPILADRYQIPLPTRKVPCHNGD